MLADILLRSLKQGGHQGLRQPDGFILQAHLELYPAVLGTVQKKFAPSLIVIPVMRFH